MISKQEIDDRIDDLMIEVSIFKELITQLRYDFNEDTENVGVVFEFIDEAKIYINALEREIKGFSKYLYDSMIDDCVYVNIQGE